MTTITMTSTLTTAIIEFTFDDGGFLTGVTMSQALNKAQYSFIRDNFPIHISMIKAMAETAKSATFIERTMEISFEMFWNKYNDKDRSSKIKTQKLWNKYDKGNQVRAYYFIDKYERQRGQAEKKYATTYLADQLWNN